MQVPLDENSLRDRTGNRMDGAPLDVGAPIVEDVTDVTHLRPRGAGEDGVPLCIPLPVNAIHDAAGRSIRRLPTGDRLVPAQHGTG